MENLDRERKAVLRRMVILAMNCPEVLAMYPDDDRVAVRVFWQLVGRLGEIDHCIEGGD